MPSTSITEYTTLELKPIRTASSNPTPSQLQNSALQALSPNTLYIALYIRNDPPEANDFHWAFYHHHDTSTGGMKYDVENINGAWMTGHTRTGNIFKNGFLCVLIQIYALGNGDAEKSTVDLGIRSLDDKVNEIPDVTCRVWLLVILDKMVKEGILRFGEDPQDMNVLEKECLEIGNGFMDEAVANKQPRPLVVSKFCV